MGKNRDEKEINASLIEAYRNAGAPEFVEYVVVVSKYSNISKYIL